LNLLVGFAPFVLFALLTRLSVDLALWLAFAAAFAIGISGFLKHRVLRALDAGSVAVFGFLALYYGFVEPGLQVSAVRLIIDISLFAIALASLVARQPFTLQYARGDVSPEVLARASFVRANYLITLVWLLAFAIMAGADGAATFVPAVPVTGAVAAGLLALAVALTFTWRYPARGRRRLSRQR
jgi:hypothetical protein